MSKQKKKKTIAIIEDDVAILQLIKDVLVDEGFDCHSFPRGSLFNNSLETSSHPDLVIIDVWLDGESGKDLALSLKQDSSTKDIPIIITSAGTEAKEIAKEVGAQDFISKPFEIAELVRLAKAYT